MAGTGAWPDVYFLFIQLENKKEHPLNMELTENVHRGEGPFSKTLTGKGEGRSGRAEAGQEQKAGLSLLNISFELNSWCKRTPDFYRPFLLFSSSSSSSYLG